MLKNSAKECRQQLRTHKVEVLSLIHHHDNGDKNSNQYQATRTEWKKSSNFVRVQERINYSITLQYADITMTVG